MRLCSIHTYFMRFEAVLQKIETSSKNWEWYKLRLTRLPTEGQFGLVVDMILHCVFLIYISLNKAFSDLVRAWFVPKFVGGSNSILCQRWVKVSFLSNMCALLWLKWHISHISHTRFYVREMLQDCVHIPLLKIECNTVMVTQPKQMTK